MLSRGMFVLILIGLITQRLWASTGESLASVSRGRSTEASSVNLLFPSFVIHGMQPAGDAPSHIPRKLDGSGDVVITPGIGLEYKGQNGLLLQGAMIRDCYDNLAGSLQIGEKYQISRNADWGFSMGIYARETPIFCDAGPDSCRSIDDYNVKFVTYVRGESVDIMPMPFLHYSYAIYRDRDVQIRFKYMVNIALNEFGIEIPL